MLLYNVNYVGFVKSRPSRQVLIHTEQRNRADKNQAKPLISKGKTDVSKHGTKPEHTEQNTEHGGTHGNKMGSLLFVWLRN